MSKEYGMATVPEVVFPEADLFRAVKYSGDNSGDINTLISDFTITAETATNLTFTSAGVSRTVPRNAYLVYQDGAVTDVYLNEQDFREAFGNIAAAASHYHELVLKSGPAIAGTPEA